MNAPVHLSLDHLTALAEVARHGSLRAAAGALFITEQGVRNRLIALEQELGVELYRKARGIRRGEILTAAGRALLPEAVRLLEQAGSLRDVVQGAGTQRDVHIAASQYLSTYILIDAIRQFHAKQPQIRVWLSVRTERDIEQALLSNPELAFGVAAPYEMSPEITYTHLFSMSWSLITPQRHPLARRSRLKLADLQDHPLIVFERGSTGRQHILDAFIRRGLTPRVEMEATTTDLVVRMVAAGLGVAIVPLLPDGAVTRGQGVRVKQLADDIRPIDSGLLIRRGDRWSDPSHLFAEFIRQEVTRRGFCNG
jgi:DNA-binding transcriptional LysR family regulator